MKDPVRSHIPTTTHNADINNDQRKFHSTIFTTDSRNLHRFLVPGINCKNGTRFLVPEINGKKMTQWNFL